MGPYSLPCLTDRLLDTRWMPDPRSEPLLGIPVVGDVAYMILMDKGVHDVMPTLTHKKAEDLRMDDYFNWPSVGNHRQQLQNAVRVWLDRNPGCCGTPPALRATAPSRMKFRMSAAHLAKARTRFSRLRPGMSPAQVQNIAGKPDAIDQGLEDGSSDVDDRPSLVSGRSNNPIVGKVDEWFDPTAFVLQPAGEFGDLHRNTLTGPGLLSLDMGIVKNTKINEDMNLQFRAEFFNIINHANFGTPAVGLYTSSSNPSAPGYINGGVPNLSAGVITTTTTTSRQIQFALKLIF